ncbi:MAG: amidohydrolase [Acidobacteria bacterium]|nr:MAG: amidohydrolase [Acidobacteriota bacterium]
MSRFSVLFLIAKLALAQRPDLVLLNAQVVTMNEKQPLATAVAISGGRISWVGETSEAGQRFAGARTLDLSRATVLPGIIDAHTHLLSLGESLLKLNLKDAATPEQAAERVRERARSAAPGQWILGWGWDEGAWAAHYPTHQILSEAAPDNPVLLTGLHSFASWVNRKALQAAGITRDTKDPPNGKIIRDVSGEPTGVLTDRAQALVSRLVPPPTREETKRAIAIAAEECLRHGLTSLHEARVSAADLDAYRELIREGKLRLRIYAMLDGANAALIDEWLKHGPEIDRAANRLTVRCVKVFADGALGSRGAALFEPYSDAPDRKGVVTTPEPEIYRMTRRCLEAGFQVATHAIGDAANHFVLNAYERALKETHASGARLRIEHAQVLAPPDIPRFVKLGVIASMQPSHCTSDMVWAETRLGPQRVKGAYAWRSVLETGAHLPLSSDFPGETLDPFAGMYAAVTRQDASGKPAGGWYPAQRLTIQEALRGYTAEAAYAGFEEKDKGSIEPGKLADLTVVSADVTRAPARELLSLRVLRTIIGGEIVYSAN